MANFDWHTSVNQGWILSKQLYHRNKQRKAVQVSTNTQLKVPERRNVPECNEHWLRLYQKTNMLHEYRGCRKIQMSAGQTEVMYPPAIVFYRGNYMQQNICTSKIKDATQGGPTVLNRGKPGDKEYSTSVTSVGLIRGLGQEHSIFCYLGYCIYPSAGWLRELLLEIYDSWPGFIHRQMWSEAIYRGVAHSQGLLEALFKSTSNSHDLQWRAVYGDHVSSAELLPSCPLNNRGVTIKKHKTT